ncbi:MAG: alpha/beta fold hydrolase [Acidobacteriota bacterium]
MGAIQHVWVRSRGVNLSVEVSIPADRDDAPTVVLVHGYPDNAEVWKDVRDHLAKDFVVVAYDCRGAGQSSAPSHTRGYALGRFEDDLVAVTDLVSPDQPFHLVGHDWGSVHSWESVTEERLKGRIASFTSISGPCLDHLALWMRSKLTKPTPRNLWLVLRQMVASLYVLFFQLPLLPEMTWRLGWKKLWPTWFKWTEHQPMTPGPRQLPDALNGLGMYRANVLKTLVKPRIRVAHAPVQIIVPTQDIYVRSFLAEAAIPFVPVLWRRDVADTHWVIRKRPELIASYVREFIQWVDADRAPSLPLRMMGGRR